MADAEQDARRLMTALVDDGYFAGDAIRNTQLQIIAAGIALDGPEQDAAIAFAGGRGWIANGPQSGTIVLQPSGWDCGIA